MKESYQRLLMPAVIVFTFFAALLGVVTASTYFGYPLLQGTGFLGLIVIALISIIVGLIYIIIENPERAMRGLGSTTLLSKTLIKQMENCIDRGEFLSAMVLARAMSRTLWLEGRYKERLRLGELLQRAASSLNPPELSALTQVLIDELGWTNVELGKLEVAEMNIKEGIKYAQNAGDAYMIARGYRHLSGVAQRKGDKDNAENHLNLAEKAAGDITVERQKEEMLAGISFGRGDLCLMSSEKIKTEQARDYFLATKVIQEKLGDRERLVKTNMRLGQTYQILGERAKAHEFYYQSLKSAKELGWLQQICEVDLHLGQLMLEERKFADALKTFEEAKTIANSINLENFCDEATMLINKTQTKMKHEK